MKRSRGAGAKKSSIAGTGCTGLDWREKRRKGCGGLSGTEKGEITKKCERLWNN